jgi:hypothetical protein
MQILNNQPTAITQTQRMTDDELFGRLQQLAQTIRERAALQERKQPLAQEVPSQLQRKTPEPTANDANPAPGVSSSFPGGDEVATARALP